jgi:hypothetical protein
MNCKKKVVYVHFKHKPMLFRKDDLKKNQKKFKFWVFFDKKRAKKS